MVSDTDYRVTLWHDGYWALVDENTELKAQILDKNDLIGALRLERNESVAAMRRELNAANNKVARLQQLVSPEMFLASR